MKRLMPAAVLLALTLVSCYRTKEFTIHTDPEGAQIAINGVPYEGMTTPMTIEVAQDKDLGIIARKPGYEVASHTVRTDTSIWGAIFWNGHDPRAQYIKADEVTIPMRKIPSAGNFKPTVMPAFQPPRGISDSAVPALREMPEF